MLATKLGLTQDLMAKFPPAFHDCSKHLIVAAASEKNLASVQLEEGATDGPDVDAKIVRYAEDCSILALQTPFTVRKTH